MRWLIVAMVAGSALAGCSGGGGDTCAVLRLRNDSDDRIVFRAEGLGPGGARAALAGGALIALNGDRYQDVGLPADALPDGLTSVRLFDLLDDVDDNPTELTVAVTVQCGDSARLTYRDGTFVIDPEDRTN